MASMRDDRGNHIDYRYDKDRDMTSWELWNDDPDIPTGGGQSGGDIRDGLRETYEEKGFRRDSPSH